MQRGVAPDVYAETFSAAVDYLGMQTFVDRNRIRAIGICASGGLLISTPLNRKNWTMLKERAMQTCMIG